MCVCLTFAFVTQGAERDDVFFFILQRLDTSMHMELKKFLILHGFCIQKRK